MVATPAEREEMIAVAAYFLAEQRGFAPGSDDDDWLEAEQRIDAMLEDIRRRGVGRRQFLRTGLRNALKLRHEAPDDGDPTELP
jgi:hypothetical protein